MVVERSNVDDNGEVFAPHQGVQCPLRAARMLVMLAEEESRNLRGRIEDLEALLDCIRLRLREGSRKVDWRPTILEWIDAAVQRRDSSNGV